MIDRLNKHLSLTRQCQLLGLSRSSLYYQPATDNTEDLALMARIVPGDAVLRLAQDWLRREGHGVNRKRG
jgi:putative transposase